MAGEIGTAYVGVEFQRGAAAGAMGGLQSELTSQMGPVGGAVSQALGSSLKLGIAGAVAGAVVVIGKELYKLGQTFDELGDDIAKTTGATGKELDGLVESAKKVATTVPTSFEKAGQAIGQIGARTGLSGRALEGLSAQLLELSRLTGQDLNRVIESSTRLLGDWGLKGKEASQGMDALFRASQATGVPVTNLAETITKFGGPLRQMGFSFEEAAAMAGKFEAEGVNTELVMGSMRIALGKLAKAGKEPVQAFREQVEAIRTAGDAGKANALALELFGARAGPDMAAAIREGRFSIDELVGTIKSGESTILGTGKATADFSEQWQMFKNQVAVGLAPVATALFDAVNRGLTAVVQHGPGAATAIREFATAFGPAFQSARSIVESLLPVFAAVFGGVAAIVQAQLGVWQAFAGVVGGVLATIAALLRGDFSAAWDGVKATVSGLGDVVVAVLNLVQTVLLQATAPFRLAAEALGNAIKGGIETIVATIAGAVEGLIQDAVNAVTGLVGAAADAARSWGAAVLNAIKAALATVGSAVRGLVQAGVTAVLGLVGEARSAGDSVGTAVWNGIKAGLEAAKDLGTKLAGYVRDATKTAVGAATTLGTAIGAAIWEAIKAAVGDVGSWVGGMIDGAVSHLPGRSAAVPPAGGAGGGVAPAAAFQAGPLEPAGGLPTGPQALAGSSGAGLAGQVPLGVRLRRLGGLELEPAPPPPVNVRVFIGDRELTDLVRAEVRYADDETARVLLAGSRAA